MKVQLFNLIAKRCPATVIHHCNGDIQLFFRHERGNKWPLFVDLTKDFVTHESIRVVRFVRQVPSPPPPPHQHCSEKKGGDGQARFDDTL